jgi:hypothetical protein
MPEPEDMDDSAADRYVKDRVQQYIGWYDAKAVTMKKWHVRSRVLAAVAAVLVPAINPFSYEATVAGHPFDLVKAVVSVLSVAVALAVSLQGVLRHREQWQNYRTTEQFLSAQKVLFQNRAGEYDGLTDAAAFKRLVANVEQAIKNENEVTLNVLTRTANEAEGPST